MADNKSFSNAGGRMLTQGSNGSIAGATSTHGPETTRRDFMALASTAMAAVGVVGVGWAFVDSMNPAADTLALSSIDVDLKPIAAGQRITAVWQGKPVFIDRRMPDQIKAAQAVNVSELRDPQTDASRVQKPEWLIVVGICTHLGCIPLGQKATDPRGEFGGWFCPCHGSQYDTSGRIRKGPAPLNLKVPKYAFTTDTSVKIG